MTPDVESATDVARMRTGAVDHFTTRSMHAVDAAAVVDILARASRERVGAAALHWGVFHDELAERLCHRLVISRLLLRKAMQLYYNKPANTWLGRGIHHCSM